MRMPKAHHAQCVGIGLGLAACLLLTACQPATPPAQRASVTLPVLSGDLERGKQVYARECSQCHQLSAGQNSKGPQLLRIYGAKAADLADYQSRYSQALKQSGWRWDAVTLDRYLADPAVALPNGKMLSDPLPAAADRQAVIAYLSTLR